MEAVALRIRVRRSSSARVKAIAARRVILATVPHVTIAPLARGVNPVDPGKKWQPGSRFFPYYSDPWIGETSFRPGKHRHLTHQQARAIDSAIDQYNTTITTAVRQARTEGRDWYVMDLCGLLDSLAYRRFDDDPLAAERNDWVPYVLPTPIGTLDTRFFLSNKAGRIQGGLFGLDGIHPTVTGYGIVAQEILDVLAVAGVTAAADRLRRLAAAGLAQLAASRPRQGHARDPRPVRDGPAQPPQRGVAQPSPWLLHRHGDPVSRCTRQ